MTFRLGKKVIPNELVSVPGNNYCPCWLKESEKTGTFQSIVFHWLACRFESLPLIVTLGPVYTTFRPQYVVNYFCCYLHGFGAG